MQTIFPELILTDVDADSAEDAIRKVGQHFLEQGFVKDSYIDAAVKREGVFPTGLQLQNLGIAMPHTDPEHVNKPGVCIAQLKKPVTFSHMGEPETKVEAEILFMMAVLDPNEQVHTLQSVLNVFQKPELAGQFKNAADKETLYEVAKKYIV